MKKILKDNSGVSLIVAIIFASVLMLVTAGMAEVTITTIRNISNADFSQKTQYIAFGAEDIAYQFSADNVLGKNAEINGSSEQYDELNDYINFLGKFGVSCFDCVGFRVVGRSEASAKLKIGGTGSEYFSAPAAYKDENNVTVGTGNAAEKCEDPDDADDPCHWNRIYLNDVVEIPLYYVDDSGQTQKLGDTDNFKLRVRAPCEDYKDGVNNCAANERIELYPKLVLFKSEYAGKPFGDPKKDKVLIQWLISDSDSGETLFANDVLDKSMQPHKRPFPNNSSIDKFVGNNTEISGGRINDANEKSTELPLSDFIMLEQNYKGMDLGKNPEEINTYIPSFTKPTLRLNLVGQPRKLPENYDFINQPDLNPNDTDFFVPYLEYQFLSKDKSIVDNKITLFGWATISDFYKKIKTEKYLPKTEGGFVLGNL